MPEMRGCAIAGCWGEYPATEAAGNADVILAVANRASELAAVARGRCVPLAALGLEVA